MVALSERTETEEKVKTEEEKTWRDRVFPTNHARDPIWEHKQH